MSYIENVGEKFNVEAYLEAQKLCKKVVGDITKQLTQGMCESEGQLLIKEEFKKVGITKFWHPSKFRIASDTIKNFRDLPNEKIKLTNGDILYIDVGPIYQDHEADFGESVIFGEPLTTENKELTRLVEASKKIWQKTAELWKKNKISGVELYEKAEIFAKELNYTLNSQMGGHRLSDFPHALHSNKHLSEIEFSPKTHLWVLEIHIIDEKKTRGAFFEDILM